MLLKLKLPKGNTKYNHATTAILTCSVLITFIYRLKVHLQAIAGFHTERAWVQSLNSYNYER